MEKPRRRKRHPEGVARRRTSYIFCLCGLFITGSLLAPEKGSASAESGTFARVVESVQPAVVSISVSRPRGYEFAVASKRRRSVAGFGSGVIIDRAGHVLTNHHVVEGAVALHVQYLGASPGDPLGEETFPNSASGEWPVREVAAEVIGIDPDTDLALIRMLLEAPLADANVAVIGNSDAIRVGDWVLAFGSPFGFHQTVSAGVLSARGRHLDQMDGGSPPPYQSFLQTDASINPGNSGGPLVDMQSRVVGINTAYNPGGRGIGFAIPINLASNVASQLLAYGEVVRGFLGIHPQDLTPDLSAALRLAHLQGALVAEVKESSPAYRSGIRRGDTILALSGKAIVDSGGLLTAVANHRPGDRVVLSVLRGPESLNITVELGRRPPADSARPAYPSSDAEADWPGFDVADRGGLEARRLNAARTGQGVVVTYVTPGSPSEHKGVVRGDVVMEIDGTGIWNTGDFRKVLKSGSSAPRLILLETKDQGRLRYIAIQPQAEP